MKDPAGAHLHLLLPTLQLQGEEHGRDPRPNKSPGQFVGILLKPSSEGRLPIRGQEQPDVLLVMRPQPRTTAPLSLAALQRRDGSARGNKSPQRVCPARAAPSPPRTSTDLQPRWDQHGLSGASGCPASSGPGACRAGGRRGGRQLHECSNRRCTRWKGLGLSPWVFHATQGEQQVPPLGAHTHAQFPTLVPSSQPLGQAPELAAVTAPIRQLLLEDRDCCTAPGYTRDTSPGAQGLAVNHRARLLPLQQKESQESHAEGVFWKIQVGNGPGGTREQGRGRGVCPLTAGAIRVQTKTFSFQSSTPSSAFSTAPQL